MAAISGPISLDRLQVIAALEAAIMDIEARHAAYEKDIKTYPKLKKDWNKKVSALLKKEGEFKESSMSLSYDGHKMNGDRNHYASQTIYIDEDNPAFAKLMKEMPPRPEAVLEVTPHKIYGKPEPTPILEDLRTAVKMYKMSNDTNIKVSVKTSWMHYIK